MTATTGLRRFATRELRLTSRIDEAAAAPGISRPVNDLVRTGQAGAVIASRSGLIGSEHLGAFAGGDGA